LRSILPSRCFRCTQFRDRHSRRSPASTIDPSRAWKCRVRVHVGRRNVGIIKRDDRRFGSLQREGFAVGLPLCRVGKRRSFREVVLCLPIGTQAAPSPDLASVAIRSRSRPWSLQTERAKRGRNLLAVDGAFRRQQRVRQPSTTCAHGDARRSRNRGGLL
jgi:hypothetical protein